MRVACRKFPLFLPDFGAIPCFFQEDLLWPTEYKERSEVQKIDCQIGDRKIVTEPYGGRDHVKFIVISKLYYIDLASFRPWQLTRSYPVGKKISRCYNRGITHSRVTFNSLENLVPAQVSAGRRTESHKKQSNTTLQNETKMETNQMPSHPVI